MNLEKILLNHTQWLNGKGGEKANLQGADLLEANLIGAALKEADLRRADLRGADLRRADLRGATLQGADLRRAHLREANLIGAHLRGADLRETALDFSCFPLWCGSFDMIVDDRLVAQILYHVAKLNISSCSKSVREEMSRIKKMAITDLFREYRDDIK